MDNNTVAMVAKPYFSKRDGGMKSWVRIFAMTVTEPGN